MNQLMQTFNDANQDEDFDEQVVKEITQNQGLLSRYIHRSVLSPHAVDDILQEVNTVVWKKRGHWDPETPFLKWAYRIAFFQIKAYQRDASRDKKRYLSDELLDLIADEAPMDHREEEFSVRCCLEKLPTEQRELIQYRYYREMPVQDIAQKMNLSANHVSQKLRRIRLALFKCMKGRQS